MFSLLGMPEGNFWPPVGFFLFNNVEHFIFFQAEIIQIRALLDISLKKNTLPTTLVWSSFWIWVLSLMTQSSLTVLNDCLYFQWQWKQVFPLPLHSIRSFDAVSEFNDYLGPLPPPSSSTSDPHFWNQCFLFFFFFLPVYVPVMRGIMGREGGMYWVWLGVLRRQNTTSDLIGYVYVSKVRFSWYITSKMVLNWRDCIFLAFEIKQVW